MVAIVDKQSSQVKVGHHNRNDLPSATSSPANQSQQTASLQY